MSFVVDEVLVTRNPATGAEVGRVRCTPSDAVEEIVLRASKAQEGWSRTAWRERKRLLARWAGVLSREAESWVEVIRDEVGKPESEALAGDVIPTLDAVRWTIRNAPKALADKRIGPGWQRFLLMPSGRLEWCPLGVIGIIGTWNYPLFLNAAPIAQALAAGNAVVWKPSELAIRVGQKIQESLEETGFPPDLVAAVYGGPEVGRALVGAEVNKGMFTGGITAGRQVLSSLASRGIPGIAELSGFDPAIVLDDAPQESTVEALTWAAFVGCGQTCVAVKRVYIVGDPSRWVSAFAARARELVVGDPARRETDLGPMITASARARFHEAVQAAVQAGARVCFGGRSSAGPGWFYAPTVLEADGPEPETALAGAFGPCVLIRGVADEAAAVDAANSSPYALAASVWGRNRRKARDVARRLHAGMVSVNEAVVPTAHAAAPFGGWKNSGYGRTHGALGIREFAQTRVLFERHSGGFRPQLFPYANTSSRVTRFLSLYRRIFHPAR